MKIQRNDPRAGAMQKAFHSIANPPAHGQMSRGQEMATWFQVCVAHAAGQVNCGSFGAQLYGMSFGSSSVLIAGVFVLGQGPNGADDFELSTESLRFAQTDFNENFSTGKGAAFKGLSIDDVAAQLKSGALAPSEVPLNVVVRDGYPLVSNTRSTIALIRAGIPQSEWTLVNRTGDPEWEGRVTDQLDRNGLSSSGYPLTSMRGITQAGDDGDGGDGSGDAGGDGGGGGGE